MFLLSRLINSPIIIKNKLIKKLEGERERESIDEGERGDEMHTYCLQMIFITEPGIKLVAKNLNIS